MSMTESKVCNVEVSELADCRSETAHWRSAWPCPALSTASLTPTACSFHRERIQSVVNVRLPSVFFLSSPSGRR